MILAPPLLLPFPDDSIEFPRVRLAEPSQCLYSLVQANS